MNINNDLKEFPLPETFFEFFKNLDLDDPENVLVKAILASLLNQLRGYNKITEYTVLNDVLRNEKEIRIRIFKQK
jgi:hypothetical protein